MEEIFNLGDLINFTKEKGYNLNNIMPVNKELMKRCLLEDKHLNNIPLRKWDKLQHYLKPIILKYNKEKRGLAVWSLSECVCLAKEWARTEYLKGIDEVEQ